MRSCLTHTACTSVRTYPSPALTSAADFETKPRQVTDKEQIRTLQAEFPQLALPVDKNEHTATHRNHAGPRKTFEWGALPSDEAEAVPTAPPGVPDARPTALPPAPPVPPTPVPPSQRSPAAEEGTRSASQHVAATLPSARAGAPPAAADKFSWGARPAEDKFSWGALPAEARPCPSALSSRASGRGAPPTAAPTAAARTAPPAPTATPAPQIAAATGTQSAPPSLEDRRRAAREQAEWLAQMKAEHQAQLAEAQLAEAQLAEAQPPPAQPPPAQPPPAQPPPAQPPPAQPPPAQPPPAQPAGSPMYQWGALPQ